MSEENEFDLNNKAAERPDNEERPPQVEKKELEKSKPLPEIDLETNEALKSVFKKLGFDDEVRGRLRAQLGNRLPTGNETITRERSDELYEQYLVKREVLVVLIDRMNGLGMGRALHRFTALFERAHDSDTLAYLESLGDTRVNDFDIVIENDTSKIIKLNEGLRDMCLRDLVIYHEEDFDVSLAELKDKYKDPARVFSETEVISNIAFVKSNVPGAQAQGQYMHAGGMGSEAFGRFKVVDPTREKKTIEVELMADFSARGGKIGQLKTVATIDSDFRATDEFGMDEDLRGQKINSKTSDFVLPSFPAESLLISYISQLQFALSEKDKDKAGRRAVASLLIIEAEKRDGDG